MRIRTKRHELIITPGTWPCSRAFVSDPSDEKYTLVVLQDPGQ